MSRVTIYTNIYCVYCNAAKALLGKKGLEYREVDLSSEPDLRLRLVEKYRWRTIPLILIGDKVIGGFAELYELENTGELDRLLENELLD
ncbi:MAG: glutaredoxin domain-containing protein [Deltaproteobacteria bacterium]